VLDGLACLQANDTSIISTYHNQLSRSRSRSRSRPRTDQDSHALTPTQ